MNTNDVDYENEYKTLMEHRDYKLKCWTDFITFTITITITILGVAFSIPNPNPYFFLLPNLIIIPMIYRIRNCKYDAELISSYVVVFLEPKIKGRNYYTHYQSFTEQKDYNKIHYSKLHSFFSNTLPMLSLATVFLFFIHIGKLTSISFITVIMIVTWELIAVLPVFDRKKKGIMIEQWKKVISKKS